MDNSGLLTSNYMAAIGGTKLVIIYCGASEKSSFFFFFTFEIFVQIEFSFFFSFFSRRDKELSDPRYCIANRRFDRPRLLFYISITPCFAC